MFDLDWLWVLAVFGLTNGLSTSKLFRPSWDKLCASSKSYLSLMGDVFRCPMCLGFWVSAAFSVFWYSPTENLFADMCVGSGTTWLPYNLSCLMYKEEDDE